MTKKPIQITPDMSIVQVTDLVPRAATILADYNIGCHGCFMGGVEALRDGLMAHGLGEDDVTSVVDQINAIANEPIPTINIDGIEFSEDAYDKLLEYIRNDSKKRTNLGLRMEINESGQPPYYFDLVAGKKPEEKLLTNGSLKIFITKQNHDAFKKRLIDWRDTAFGTGFKVMMKE